MKLQWTEQGWDDYLYWQSNDVDMVAKINVMIKDARRSPFRGLGKPEPLRNDMAGWWSRRLTQEHRLVYRVTGKGDAQALEIAACRFHYGR
ncbi:MAG: Txe/YoeB family addiction module toxin [Aliihoeflea sp.]|uniref:Txe/YoeB family addiction module toxin n=1 Tax=Aliihoeflea sp. TaxID=2608088 RepID=UPI0040331B53